MPEHPAGAALAVTRSPDYAHGETMTERGTGAPPPDAPVAPFPAPAAGIPIPLPSLAARPEGEAAPDAHREVVVALHAIASHLVRIVFMSRQRSQQRWFWAVIVPLSIMNALNFFR